MGIWSENWVQGWSQNDDKKIGMANQMGIWNGDQVRGLKEVG